MRQERVLNVTKPACAAKRVVLLAALLFVGPSPLLAQEFTGSISGQVTDQVNDCVGLRAREGARVAAYLKTLATSN